MHCAIAFRFERAEVKCAPPPPLPSPPRCVPAGGTPVEKSPGVRVAAVTLQVSRQQSDCQTDAMQPVKSSVGQRIVNETIRENVRRQRLYKDIRTDSIQLQHMGVWSSPAALAPIMCAHSGEVKAGF